MSVRAPIAPPAMRLPAAFASSGYALRIATAADATFERALFENARSDAAVLANWPDAMRTVFLDQQFHFQTVHYARAHPAADRLIVLAGIEPIGRMIVDRAADEWVMVDIALLPIWRGHGIGRALVDTVLTAAADANASVALQVETGNPAQRLYERAGFIAIETEPPWCAMRWTSAPAAQAPLASAGD